MPRPRIYNDPADRQAAYRARTYWQKEPTQMFLAGVARSLHTQFARALASGTCPLPADILGAHAGQTMANLRDYVEFGSLEAAKQARSIPGNGPNTANGGTSELK